MTIYSSHNILLAASALSLGAAGAPAFAQATPAQQAPQAASSDDQGVQEIVVTAQRRSENVLNVPLSIQAASGQQLQTQGIKQITDLQFITPGYNVSDANGYTQVFIRGVGNAIFVGADPSVATFIDDVPRIYGSMVNNFVDVDRVEVLKGAQGGLYGRNATGGVINIITKQPSTDEVKGNLRVSYGEKNTFDAAGYINLPISDKIAFSVSAERRSHSPYIKNVAPKNPYTAAMFPANTTLGTPAQTAALLNSGVDNRDIANENFWATDAKLLLKPSDNLKITIAGDYSSKNDTNGNANYNITPAFTQGVLAGTLDSVLYPVGTPLAGNHVQLPAGFEIGNPKKFTVGNGTAGFVQLKDYGVSGTIVWSLPGVDLTSISAYRNQHTYFIDDLGGSSAPLTAALVNNHKHFAYQEFRAVSTFDGPLHLIGGATYLKDYFRGATDVYLLGNIANFPVARAIDRKKNWSVYAQAAYDLTDHLTLTASGRYIHEKNNALFQISGTPYSATEHKFLPSATVSYKLDGGGNVYVRWARGFKSGGINVVADVAAFPNPTKDGSVFKGETVDTYEAGYRGTFFDRKVQVTGAVFYNDYKNLQTAAHTNAQYANTIILALINAGTARTYGVEGSVNWKVIPALQVGLNAGYLNAKYKHFALSGSQVLSDFDLSHTQMINAPKFQIAYTGNLDYPITDDFRLVGSLLVQHTSSVLYQVSGAPGAIPPAVGKAYWLTNARLGVRTTDDKYEVAVFANNLFNNAYQTYGNSNEGTSTQLTWGNPRIVGVEFNARF